MSNRSSLILERCGARLVILVECSHKKVKGWYFIWLFSEEERRVTVWQRYPLQNYTSISDNTL